MTVSFSNFLPQQTIYFLQRSTHFSKTCCIPLITLKFLASELPFHCWKSPEIAWGEIWTVWKIQEFRRSTFSKPKTKFNSDLAPCDFWAFPTKKRELRGNKFQSDQLSAARFREVAVAL
jgi:hypothetical protein